MLWIYVPKCAEKFLLLEVCSHIVINGVRCMVVWVDVWIDRCFLVRSVMRLLLEPALYFGNICMIASVRQVSKTIFSLMSLRFLGVSFFGIYRCWIYVDKKNN